MFDENDIDFSIIKDIIVIEDLIEIREYYQTDDIKWLSNKSRWKGLKSIGIVEKTIKRMIKKQRKHAII